MYVILVQISRRVGFKPDLIAVIYTTGNIPEVVMNTLIPVDKDKELQIGG